MALKIRRTTDLSLKFFFSPSKLALWYVIDALHDFCIKVTIYPKKWVVLMPFVWHRKTLIHLSTAIKQDLKVSKREEKKIGTLQNDFFFLFFSRDDSHTKDDAALYNFIIRQKRKWSRAKRGHLFSEIRQGRVNK